MTNPRPSTDSRDNSVVAGVRRALELLCHLSPKQMAVTGEKKRYKSIDEECFKTAQRILKDC